MIYFLFFVLLILVIVLFIKVSDLKLQVYRIQRHLREKGISLDTAAKNIKTPIIKEEPAAAPSAAKAQSQQQPIAPNSNVATLAAEKPIIIETSSKASSASANTSINKNSVTQNAFIDRTLNYFLSGNIIAKIGIVILFIGVLFLLKYASTHGYFPLSARLVCAAVVGAAILVCGWLLQPKKMEYGLILQGGGIGIFYAVTFVTYRVYHLLPVELTFALFLIITTTTVVLSLLQDSKVLIILALTGAFLTPLVAAGPNGNEIVLFSYYVILNCGIAIIAWFKNWRALNLIGFVFAFVLAALWGAWQYNTSSYLTTQIFLIIYTLIYTIISFIFFRHNELFSNKQIDGFILLGVPLVSFLIQCSLVYSFHYGIAISALCYIAYYISLAWFVYIWKGRLGKLIIEVYLYYSYIFALVAILFFFDRNLITVLWSLAALLLLWYGLKEKQPAAQIIANVILCLIGFYILCIILLGFVLNINANTYINNIITSLIVITAACLFKHNSAHANREQNGIAHLLYILGTLAWFLSSLALFHHYHIENYSLFYFALMSIIFGAITAKLRIVYLEILSLIVLPYALVYLLAHTFIESHIFLQDYLSWIVTYLCMYIVLYLSENYAFAKKFLTSLHTYTYLIFLSSLALILAKFLKYDLHLTLLWSVSILGCVPLLGLLAVFVGTRYITWPYCHYKNTYMHIVGGIIICVFYFYTLLINLSILSPAQEVIYLPILNALGLVQTFGLSMMIYWILHVREWLQKFTKISTLLFTNALIVWGFVWLTASTLRSLHAWTGVSTDFLTIVHSGLIQTTLTIVWSLSALLIIAFATYKHSKFTWWVGLVILGITIVKLFFFDLANVNTLARIVSFIVVGIILLIIGYFSPVFNKKYQLEKE